MKADYHVHTPYCGHAQGAIVEYVEAAIEAGLEEIGFADHLGRYYLGPPQRRRYWDWGMKEGMVQRYIQELLHLQDAYQGRISIKIGLEADYVEGAEDLLDALLRQYPFDFVLGSIHCLPAFSWRHLAETPPRQPERLFQAYFDSALGAVKSGFFQVLAHLDFIWRYVKWPRQGSIRVDERIAEVVGAAAQHGVAVEVNANAYLWSQLYSVEAGDPFELLLDCIRSAGAMITLGSDAHAPRFVAKAFPQLHEVIAARQIRTMALFQAREPRIVELG